MRFPLHITTDAIRHQIKQGVQGNKRYPMVLMLEPLYTCNLACIGCAIERHTGKLEDGSWKDASWTGTGFPTVFYLRYHLYASYFPLLALGMYAQRFFKD